MSTAQAATINTYFLSEPSITPNPAGPGQQINIIGTMTPAPPSGHSYPITISVIDSNGNYRTIGTSSTHLGSGTFNFSWVPDITGKYIVICDYRGENLSGNIYTRCQSNSSFLVDGTFPAAPTPSQLPTSIPTNSPSTKLETSLNVHCQSSTTYSDFKVNIQGTLTANNAALADAPIQLSYSVNGGTSWTPLTLVSTDDTGGFQAVWTPLVTGNYFLNATYEGNSEMAPASTIVSFAVLPAEENSVFSVASNSTVTALAFNSASQELRFEVSGESGTTGYVNVYISNSLMSDVSRLRVYLDNEELQPSTQAQGDSWLVSFTYHHSTHSVALELNSDSRNTSTQTQKFEYVIVGILVATVAVVIIMTIKRKQGKKAKKFDK